MKEGEKGQDLNYKLILNPDHKTTAKFDMGERTGRKADPDQVQANSIRNARNERNERLFEREEWLTKTQITSFFSRLASRQKSRGQDASTASTDATARPEEDENQDIEAVNSGMRLLRFGDDINEEIGLTNPIVLTPMIFVTIIRTETIGIFSVAMLKTILHHFEVLFRAKD